MAIQFPAQLKRIEYQRFTQSHFDVSQQRYVEKSFSCNCNCISPIPTAWNHICFWFSFFVCFSFGHLLLIAVSIPNEVNNTDRSQHTRMTTNWKQKTNERKSQWNELNEWIEIHFYRKIWNDMNGRIHSEQFYVRKSNTVGLSDNSRDLQTNRISSTHTLKVKVEIPAHRKVADTTTSTTTTSTMPRYERVTYVCIVELEIFMELPLCLRGYGWRVGIEVGVSISSCVCIVLDESKGHIHSSPVHNVFVKAQQQESR